MSNETLAPMPVREAFEAYKQTDEYQNTRRWALHEKHVDGSLWAAWHKGFSENETRLRALLAERDALMGWQIMATRLLDEAGAMIPSDESTDCWHRKVDELISPNATLSEGERG